VVVLLAVTGCTVHKRWAYQPSGHPGPAGGGRDKIGVLPFHDDRDVENTNYLAMYLFPGFPFGWADYGVPEQTAQHVTSLRWLGYEPTRDFAQALADELRASGFDATLRDSERVRPDVTIEGTIRNTRYRGKVFTYGLSYLGELLWYIGLPMATFSNELEVELVCFDTKRRQVILSKRYAAPPIRAVSWVYPLKNDFNYSAMLAGIYGQFTQDLAGVLPPRAAAGS